jgi:hypothetical protein
MLLGLAWFLAWVSNFLLFSFGPRGFAAGFDAMLSGAFAMLHVALVMQ